MLTLDFFSLGEEGMEMGGVIHFTTRRVC